MRFLLMGKGNIANTLLSIIRSLGEQYDIVTCDLKEDHIRGQDYLMEFHDRFDAVINLTDDKVPQILELCEQYGLKYIDAGYEDENEVFVENYLKLIKADTKTVRLLGFGMNPGLVELMPYMITHTKPYIACVFETDLPELRKKTDPPVFATWAPATYYDEAVVMDSFLSSKAAVCQYVSDEERYNIELTTKDGSYLYHIIPHEEVFNIQGEEALCQGSAFVFHAPTALQEYMLKHKDEQADELLREIYVNNDLSGTESVGILLYDGTDNVRYIRNISDHGKCCDKLGYNASCYQTACGIYIAMQLLRQIPNGTALTFTAAAKRYKKEILQILEKLDFKIDIVDNYMAKEEFEEKLLPLFKSKTITNPVACAEYTPAHDFETM